MKIKPYLVKLVFYSAIMLICITTLNINAQEDIKIEVKQINAQKALVLKADVPTGEIGPKMGELYGKLFGYLGQNQIQPAGPPFAYYLSFNPQGNTVFEAGVPVMEEINVSGEFEFKIYQETKAVSTMYTGPYEKMETAYNAIEKYIKDNNLKDKGVSCEVYLTDPAEEPDSSKYQTIIYFPVE